MPSVNNAGPFVWSRPRGWRRSDRAQERQLEGPIPLWWIGPFRFFACYHVSPSLCPPVNSSTAISGRAPSRMGKLMVPMPQLTYTCELRC